MPMLSLTGGSWPQIDANMNCNKDGPVCRQKANWRRRPRMSTQIVHAILKPKLCTAVLL